MGGMVRVATHYLLFRIDDNNIYLTLHSAYFYEWLNRRRKYVNDPHTQIEQQPQKEKNKKQITPKTLKNPSVKKGDKKQQQHTHQNRQLDRYPPK